MTHPVNAQAEDAASHPTSESLVSDVATQMQRIELARQRIQASSYAISSGALAATLDQQTCASPIHNPGQQRLESMGRAMDQVLHRMQCRSLADIDKALQQQTALREFQHNMAREQQKTPARNGVYDQATAQSRIDSVIDVEAKPAPAPTTVDSSVQPPHQH